MTTFVSSEAQENHGIDKQIKLVGHLFSSRNNAQKRKSRNLTNQYLHLLKHDRLSDGQNNV